MISEHFSKFVSSPRAKRLGSALRVIWMTTFCVALVAMFFTGRYPWLNLFVWWALVITWGAPILALAIAIVGAMIILPGVELAKLMIDGLRTSNDAKLARRLTVAWCSGAGMLFSLVLGTGFTLSAFGILDHVNVWFLVVCWLVLMIPWALVGLLGRSLFRRYSSRVPRPASQATTFEDNGATKSIVSKSSS